jgi:hypothetical protein
MIAKSSQKLNFSKKLYCFSENETAIIRKKDQIGWITEDYNVLNYLPTNL